MSSTVQSAGQVDGLGNGAADEGLGGAHHFQVGHVADAALAAKGLEGAVEDREVLRLQAGGDGGAVFLDVLDGVEFGDVGDDGGDFRLGVMPRRRRASATPRLTILRHAAAGEQFIFDQRDVRLDAGGVAIHEEGDGAGGGQDGDLGVAVAGFRPRSRARSQVWRASSLR
jgi:hypothetical protein